MNVYHIILTDDWEYADKNKPYENSGVMFVEDLDDIARLMEDEWGLAKFSRTSSMDKNENSLFYSFLSPFNSTSYVYRKSESYPYRTKEIEVCGSDEDFVINSIKSLGLNCDCHVSRRGNPL